MTPIDTNVRAGQCHCGAVRFEARSAMASFDPPLHLLLLPECEAPSLSWQRWVGSAPAGRGCADSYRFHTDQAHFFCSAAEYTHIINDDPTRTVCRQRGLLDGVSPFHFSEVPVWDGVNHTMTLAGQRVEQARCRFIPAD